MKSIKILLCLLAVIYSSKIISQYSEFLDINDVLAEVNADGRLFQSGFKVPKRDNRSTIDEVNIWIGGYDNALTTHIAAQTLTPESDFSYGPIGDQYDINYHSKYKRVWKVSKVEILHHTRDYQSPGYIPVRSIVEWPGNGDVTNGESKILAPFSDLNKNGIYEPLRGDFPIIRGDQAIYFILNDVRSDHVKTGSDKFGFEIHGMVYAFEASVDSALNQTVFLNLKITNYSKKNYEDVRTGFHSSFLLGTKGDEVIGYKEGLNLGYMYNSDDLDGFYGRGAPAQGMMFLSSPAHSFMYYFNNFAGNFPPQMIEPSHLTEYYNFLSSRWRDGTPLTFGGNGYNPGSPNSTHFAFTGIPGTNGWTQSVADGEFIKYSILSSEPMALMAGHSICFDLAFPFARDYKGTNISSALLLFDRAQYIFEFYRDSIGKCKELNTSVENTNLRNGKLTLYPNPTNGLLNIGLPHVSEFKSISIYNQVGKLIIAQLEIPFGHSNINIDKLETGIYFVKYFNGGKLFVEKLIKY